MSPIKWFFRQIWWSFPLVLWGVGSFLPPLQLPVFAVQALSLGGFSFPSLAPVSSGATVFLLSALLVSVILAAIWNFSEFFAVSDQFEPVNSLRINSAVSILVAFVLVGSAGFLLASYSLPWAIVVPCVSSMLDAFMTVDRAINNAAQKPIVTGKVGGV